jgi:hypothetical protein
MRSRSPAGQSDDSGDVSDKIGALLHQEFILCSRLAGEVLANALFVADAHISDATSPELTPAARKALASARTAISQAARSGLVLLTSGKPGLEPIEAVDIDKKLALAKTMLRRIDPETPEIEITRCSEKIPLVRLPTGLPCRLLIRATACFPTARRMHIELGRGLEQGLEQVTIRFATEVGLFEDWIPHVEELIKHTGGTLASSERSLKVVIPASWEYQSQPDAAEDFLNGSSVRTPDHGRRERDAG